MLRPVALSGRLDVPDCVRDPSQALSGQRAKGARGAIEKSRGFQLGSSIHGEWIEVPSKYKQVHIRLEGTVQNHMLTVRIY